MTELKSTYIFILSSILFLACTPTHEYNQLLLAESLMDDNPDSAFSIINSINTENLISKSDQALYALLFSQACDKTYNYTQNDSLIAIAIDYYTGSSDTRRDMLAHYYLGRINYEIGDYTKSALAFTQSLELATVLNDYYWMGMSCRGLSGVYCSTYNCTEEFKYAQLEFEYLKNSSRPLYYHYSYLDLARAYSNQSDDSTAISLCLDIIDTAKVTQNSNLELSANRLLAQCYVSNGMSKKAFPILEQLIKSNESIIEDSIYLALTYTELNDPFKSLSLLNEIPEDNTLINFPKYKAYRKIGNQSEALYFHEIYHQSINESFRQRIGKSLIGDILSYYEINRQSAESKYQTSCLWIAFLIISFLSILTIIIIYIRHLRQKHQNELERKIIVAQQLQQSLQNIEREYSIATKSNAHLLSSKYSFFDELCKIEFESINSSSARKRTAAAVDKLIKQMTHDEKVMADLESQINTHNANLMVDFRSSLPDMPDDYYRLYIFSVLGFSDITIATFLKKEKTSQIWNLRRHLKDRIKRLPSEKVERFLRAIR